MKAYIKLIACMPQFITYQSISKIPVQLKPYEICHIAMLVIGNSILITMSLQLTLIEAKFRMELRWGLLTLQKT